MFDTCRSELRLDTDPSRKTKLEPKTDVPSFDDLLLDSIEQSLTELLGTKVREAVFDYLARVSLLARSDVSRNPAKLSTLLGRVFGRGEITIEKRIVRRLYTDLHWQYQDSLNFDFQTQVEVARRSWEEIIETSTKSMDQLPQVGVAKSSREGRLCG